MSILNREDLDRQTIRAAEVVKPVKKRFEKYFIDLHIPVLLIDPQHEIDVLKIAEENEALYIDLSRMIEYPMLCRIVRVATTIKYNNLNSEYTICSKKVRETSSIIFDNIDKIPDTEYKDEIQYLIKYALREEDDVPTPDNTYISFSNYKIGARCSQNPDYLYHGSKACPIFCMVPQE